jgi:GDPmannose 4,6-dehydratase
VRDFVNAAAQELGMELRWEGEGLEEKGYWVNPPSAATPGTVGATPGRDRTAGAPIISVDPRYFRPTEVETLLGDATKAREQLGWTPRITFGEMVREMMQNDLELAQRDALVEREGYKAFKYFE